MRTHLSLQANDKISTASMPGLELRVLAIGPKLIWARDDAERCDYVVPLRSAMRSRMMPNGGGALALQH